MKSQASLGISKWKGDFGYIKDAICKLPGIYLELDSLLWWTWLWRGELSQWDHRNCMSLLLYGFRFVNIVCSNFISPAGTHVRTLIWGDRGNVIKSPDWIIGNWVLARCDATFSLVKLCLSNCTSFLLTASILWEMSSPVISLWKIESSPVWGNIWRLY